MNILDLSKRLAKLGWIAGATFNVAAVKAAVRDYQSWWGLKPDGVAGSVTERHLNAFRFCGLPDRMDMQAQLCKWPHKKITWNITGQLPSLSAADQKAAYHLAWSYWAEVCDIQPEYSSDPRTANVLMGAGRIDQQGGTLAWSELPCGNVSSTAQLDQLYGTEEPYGVFDIGEPSQGRIDIVRVCCHECGHVIGIPHIATGNLLAPIYSTSIRKPRDGDKAEAVQRYGPPVVVPPTPTPTPTPPLDVLKPVDEAWVSYLRNRGWRCTKL